MIRRFNVRVYGILVEKGKLLVSDEFIKGREITKLPGGGLEYGEGPAECVVREFKEETNLRVAVKDYFYDTKSTNHFSFIDYNWRYFITHFSICRLSKYVQHIYPARV